MPPVTLREYTDADEPSWLRCRALSFLGSAYYDDVKVERTPFAGESVRLVAVVPRPRAVRTPGADQVVGILDVELWEEGGEQVATIDTLAVHPDHHRRGIADALLAEALRRLVPRSVTWLDAWTREDDAANAWYVRSGFHVADEYLHVYADHDEAEGFTTPAELSAPIRSFCHGRLADERALRARYDRVHRCRRYLRVLEPVRWTDDQRLAVAYDVECGTSRADHDFYLGLAERLQARRVADVGCGTGVLAVDLAERGHEVVGLDPGAAMLDVARARPGGDRVTWIHGEAEALPDGCADLVVMTGNVAQYFVTDRSWRRALAELRRALAPGGHVAFEARNPAARTRATYPHPGGGAFTSWVESVAVHEEPEGGATETHRGHTVLPGGERLVSDETLRFRTVAHLVSTLSEAGFAMTDSWGDFAGSPLDGDSPAFVLLARRE